MKLNWIDRAVSAVDPARAAVRLKGRAMVEVLRSLPAPQDALGMQAHSGGVGGVAPPSRSFWNPFARDAKADTLRFLPTQRAQSRELARTSPIAVGAINTNVDRVVGTGLALSAAPHQGVLGWTDDQMFAWKSHVQNEFSIWSDSQESDICQSLNFYEQQALVLRAVLESGDTFTLLPDGQRTPTQPYALRIQVLEADRVGNPSGVMDSARVAGGVRVNEGGAPEAYHVYDQHPGGYMPGKGGLHAGRWVERLGRSGRRRMLHHFRKLRPDMPRGVPYLAPIIDCIKQISRYTEAEIMAAVISAYFTVFIEAPAGGAAAPVFGGDQPGAGDVGNEIGIGMGAVVGLAPGEKASTANPGRPNPNFDPFVQAVIRQMGVALGIPYELLVKQFGQNYSTSRAALLDAWVYFRSVRTWLTRSFCEPVYETWLAEAVAIGRISAPGFFADPLLRWAYTRSEWHGDSMGSINPKDEVAAYTAAIDARLITRERAQWEMFGDNFFISFPQMKAEHNLLKDNDMLPVPKAGAAAPRGDDPKETP